MSKKKIVLAYSGGLDTSVMVKWLQEEQSYDVITLTIDLGQGKELEEVANKSRNLGAIETVVIDAKDIFAESFVAPALRAGALYEGEYPLATALARPLIAKFLVDTANKYGANSVAHGCTGKGNDQVRFEITIGILAPELKVLAPVREWKMNREEELEYARKFGIEVSQEKTLFSVDQNLWGRSIEAGILEDPWCEPPETAYEWTKSYVNATREALEIEVTFDKGVPTAIDGKNYSLVQIIENLNFLGGSYGIGRIDHVENRLVGIKTREVYEAPAAVLLHAAHRAVETLTLSKEQAKLKQHISKEYADMVYNGLWFSSLHQDMLAYLSMNQRFVSGIARIKLMPGNYSVVGRKSDFSLFNPRLATYGKNDDFDHTAAVGFIKVFSNSVVNQAHIQLIDQLPVTRDKNLLNEINKEDI
ncbi:MAG: argininosuccinate synthase [Clostridium sp.]|jgi:argininosuccinate synthase|nr:argininosuccinate synthase [Clostridium sp.]